MGIRRIDDFDQYRTLLHLTAGYSESETSALTGVSGKQIREYLRDPNFLAALRDAQESIFQATQNKMLLASTLAVNTLVDILQSDSTSDSNKIQAAKVVLDFSKTAREIQKEQRLEKLELLANGNLKQITGD